MIITPYSQTPGIIWPAIGDSHAAHAMALQYQLEQSQWWDAQDLFTMQMQQLSSLLAFAYSNTTFYKNFYSERGFRPKKILNAEIWRKIPIVTRHDIQQSEKELISANFPQHHGSTFDISTSGSTGRQITVKGSQVTQLFWNAFGLRDHLWHQRNLRGKLCVIKLAKNNLGKPPNGSLAKHWGSATDAIYKTGPSALLDISATLEEQANWLLHHQPQYLLTYPSNLLALSEYIQQNNIVLPNLLGIRTLGEIVTPQIRETCNKTWKVPLVDCYSCQEAGYLAIQCPEHDHYHVQSEGVLLEVLDENDSPCSPGEIGRVLITSLHNYATPLIRYENGDYAEVGDECSCGRGLPVLKQIQGRVRNMLLYPNGEKHWPYLGSGWYRETADIQQFQFIQTKLHTIEVHLVVGNMLSSEQENTLKKIIQQSLNYPFNLTFLYHNEIPRSTGGKFEDFISRLV